MKIPKIRFSRFSEEWKEEKLSNVCKVNPNSGILPEKFIYIDLESVENGVLLKENYIDLSDAPSRAQRQLIKDDILFQTVRPYQKNNFYFDKIDTEFKYVASTGYAQLRANEDSKFLYQYLHTQNFVNNVLEKCTGTSYPAINSSDLSKIIIYKPSLEEQQKIGDFFTLLDKRIEQQEQKIALLKDYKKAMMQKIFSQKIRFKDENGNDYPDWEEKMLGGIGRFYRGHSYKTVDVSSAGLLVLRSNNILNDEITLDTGLQYVTKKCSNNIILENNDIVICMANGSKNLVGKSGVFYKNDEFKDVTVGAFCSIYRSKINLSRYLFQTDKYKKYLSILFSGTNINNLKNSDLEKLKFRLPKIEEEKKITLLLQKFDKNIESQEGILKSFKSHKIVLFSKMFIK